MSYSNSYDYAIALGWDVPAVNLLNVSRLLYPHNRVTSADARMQLGVVSDSVNQSPIRLQVLDNQEWRDGTTYLEWRMMLTTGGVSFWLNTFFSEAVASINGTISKAVTINTRLTEFSTYERYNAYAIYPTLPGGGQSDPDLVYLHKRGVWSLRQRFNDLLEAS